MTNLMLGQLRFDRTCVRTLFELPQEFRHPPQLLAVDALVNVNAVDTEIGQLLNDLRVGLLVATERHAIEKHIAVDHVDSHRRPGAQMLLDGVLELANLLRDHWMSGGIRAGEPAQAGESLEDRQGIECRQRSGDGCHRFSSSRALRATRTTDGFQNRNRRGASAASAGPRPSAAA